FRLKNREEYKQWYQKNPAPQQYLDQAIYGLTEWVEEKLEGATFISNPGCFPTATLLGLGPLLKNDLIEVDSIIIDAKSGVSGAGRSLSLKAHYGERNEDLSIYKLNHHQHIPEIEQMLRRWNQDVAPITFSTHLVPMTRGIMVTMYAKAKKSVTEKQLRDIYKEKYDHHYFIGVRPEGVFPTTKEVYGSNFCDIGVTIDERTGRITVVSVIDNLMKGAAGQAVQNFNMMFGFDEKAGLDFMPIYP
ncbi:MAG TPA: N-acetyl-gamma-glutamyl-phosphate reductase, partial [Massilibacterium sp.]|nr:N-acetyl-gamma-glutamyl-phosphate reductase [Massilibacterium sp.]